MTNTRIFELTETELRDVQEKTASMLGLCKKQYDIIGQEIFSILSLYARVVFYPLGENAVWGFTKRSNCPSKMPFVTINSSISLEYQVLAAAHELYHVWFDSKTDVTPAFMNNTTTQDRNELKANQFAAEFLVSEELLFRELRLFSINTAKMTIKDILKLAELFSVPFKTMVKRLSDVHYLSKTDQRTYLNMEDYQIVQMKKRYAIPEQITTECIVIDNLTDLAIRAYEKHLITYEKLEYLLDFSALKPFDVGISKPMSSSFPSNDELDEIMGE